MMRLVNYILVAVILIISARDDQTGDCLKRGDCKANITQETNERNTMGRATNAPVHTPALPIGNATPRYTPVRG
jgi:hypothetical protein